MGGGQGHSKFSRRQQHDHPAHPGPLGEELRMAGKGYAGVVDHALVHRAGDHGRKVALAAAIKGQLQSPDHRRGVAHIKLTGHHRCGHRHVKHLVRGRVLRAPGA